MRPVSRKPVGSGFSSPPPGDFVIQPTPPVPEHMSYSANPYHAVSEPPPERQNTTASAPQRDWRGPYEHPDYSSTWNDSIDQFEYNGSRDSEVGRSPHDYGYAPSIVSHQSGVTEWESSASVVYEPPVPPEPVSPLRIVKPDPPSPETPRATADPEDQAALGIGTGSDYIKRRRQAAGITGTPKMPRSLPIGISSVPVSKKYSAPPAFVRKAMDIRYAHLPQRMLASEIDDEDNVPDSPVGRVSHDSNPSISRHGHTHSLTTVNTHSSIPRSTSSESVVEDTGKVKLFVANPDD